MPVDLSPLKNQKRMLLTVPLRPVQGSRFQPTGFPDLGAATFQAPNDSGEATSCLLVESPQSMANRLESTIWDSGENELKEFAKGLSYVRVLDDKRAHLTSSIEEAHRLNSVYIEKADKESFHKKLETEMEYGEKNPINRKKFVETVFKYDANSLLHGVFLESIGGRLRIARALSAFIEAERVEIVASGGVKNDHVQPGTEKGSERTAKEGYGNVPFPREEYSAEAINAYFSLDLSQIRGYGLSEDAKELLILLALYKIRALLDGDLRLRTACDLVVAGAEGNSFIADRPTSFDVPSLDDLENAVRDSIKECSGLFADNGGKTEVTYKFK